MEKRSVLPYRRESVTRVGLTIRGNGELALNPPGLKAELTDFFA